MTRRGVCMYNRHCHRHILTGLEVRMMFVQKEYVTFYDNDARCPAPRHTRARACPRATAHSCLRTPVPHQQQRKKNALRDPAASRVLSTGRKGW